jgi:hypothetical protein
MMASMMSFTELSQGEGGDVLKEGAPASAQVHFVLANQPLPW